MWQYPIKTFDEETLREVLIENKGPEVFLETIINEILEAEMTEHLEAEPGEQTDHRQDYPNDSYERKLATRIGSLKLEVSRVGTAPSLAELFERYQRSEKALVLMVLQLGSTRRVKKITTESRKLSGFSRQTVSNLTERLDKQVEGRPSGPSMKSICSCWPMRCNWVFGGARPYDQRWPLSLLELNR